MLNLRNPNLESPLRTSNMPSFNQRGTENLEELKQYALNLTANQFQSQATWRQTQKTVPFLCGQEMLPIKAHTLKLFKSVFLQTCPIENISQAPGWPLAGRKRRYRAWYKIFVQIFLKIFFPNFNFIYRKKGEVKRLGWNEF